ncbi:MAG TPA: XRE family transcriptional regulator [Mycobacterium sp.]|jgi:transcriptional regulator with XRE-family HTH domain|nr:XRE family transcriptional regulator [Mycobacterium sp.]
MHDEVAFGKRVREIRHQSGLTLDALASRSGVSRAALSKIERCERSPGLEIAVKIADALGTNLAQLLGGVEEPAGSEVLRGAQPSITDEATGVRRESLFPTTPGVEVVRFTFPPGVGAGPFSSHGPRSQEIFVMLDGSVSIQTGSGILHLGAHDIATISGAEEHSLRNVGQGEATLLVFIIRPETT